MALVEQLRNKDWYGKGPVQELLYGMLTGLNCLGYEHLAVTHEAALPLPNIPAVEPQVAVKALIVIEADITAANPSMCVRFREDNVPPTDSEGMPLGNLSIYEVGGIQNLNNFQVIGIEPGKIHTVRIQYFG